ncbi:hypothetical protein [Bradyrhizobium sp. CB2312]|uniref:hypothetical protein n=1 Tax=Bradyrhizobium sp. CB2312 TaxID=3039155 RepID=UPI0024B17B9F|nr:hypothetical protein [Bradyrhizobium sp. CB2312]WFU74600.1 hypothetical protein QA642_11345 [Bradyrhizobium sp. CB2312]
MMKQPVDRPEIPEIARQDRVVWRRQPHTAKIVCGDARELLRIELRHQHDLPVALGLRGEQIAKRRGSAIDAMHRHDDACVRIARSGAE